MLRSISVIRINLQLSFLLLLVAVFFRYAGNASAATAVSGNIATDTTWSLGNSPYTVTGNVQVLGGVRLTIEPGVVVKFTIGTSLSIGGELIARGTADQRILFTSSSAFPSPGDWSCIKFVSGSTNATVDQALNYLAGSIIEFSTIEYGGNHPADTTYRGGAVQITQSSPYITNNIIRNNNASNNNYGGGIYIGQTDSSYIIHNNIENNYAYRGGGIYITASSCHIVDNIILNNSAVNGGGISVISSSPLIWNNSITQNTATACPAGCGYGGGISNTWSQSNIVNNIIEMNSATTGGAIYSSSTPNPIIRQNKIADNSATSGGGITVSASFPTVKYNAITGNAGYDFYIDWGGTNSSLDIDVSSNYWGTTSPQTIDTNIFDYYDDVSLGKAIYTSFLASPPPLLIYTISLKSDETYSLPLSSPIKAGSILFIQMEGVDGDPQTQDSTSVSIKSTITDNIGISVLLNETGSNTGIYRGMTTVGASTDQANNIIGAQGGEEISIISDADPSISESVSFDQHTITATAGTGGTISPSYALVSHGDPATFTATPDTRYDIASVTGCGGVLSGSTYITGPVNSDCSISAMFSLKTYTVTAAAGTGGTISPSSALVSYGSTTTFTATPSTGYYILSVTGCNGTLSGNAYTTATVTESCTVSAQFALPDGDLDGSSDVTVVDALLALKMVAGMIPVDLHHADVAPLIDGLRRPNGTLDIGDVVVILRKAVGAITTW